MSKTQLHVQENRKPVGYRKRNGKRTNRFNVQIAFESGASLGLKSSAEVPLTPQDVVDELHWFIQRVEGILADRKAKGLSVR
jgi:hypothetical protein